MQLWIVIHLQQATRSSALVRLSNSSFTFTYDNLGRMLSQSGAGRTQSWTVDLLGRNIEHTTPLGTERWVYNPDDTLAFHCPVSGQASPCGANNTEAWKYSNARHYLRRVESIDYPERAGVPSADVTYSYFPAAYPGGYCALLATVTDSLGTTDYGYDVLSRIRTKTRTPKSAQGALLTAQAKTLTYAYKANDTALASIQYWNRGSVNYMTNAFGQATQLTDWAGQTINSTYAATGQLATATANQGTAYTKSFTYDSSRRLSRIQHTTGASNLLDLEYAPSGLPGRDANGNIRSIRETWEGESALHTHYTYDNLDRLFVAQYPSLPGIDWTGIHAYEYDAAGNVTARHDETDEEMTFSYDAADRITTPGFSHDANGNLLTTGQVTSTPSFE